MKDTQVLIEEYSFSALSFQYFSNSCVCSGENKYEIVKKSYFNLLQTYVFDEIFLGVTIENWRIE